MDDPRQIAPIIAGEHGQHPTIHFHPLHGGERVNDRSPDQLVPETHARGPHLEHAASLGGRDRRHAGRQQRLDERPVDGRRHDGQLLERRARVVIQATDPGQHGVDDRRRDAAGVAGGEHLDDKERIAGGHRVDLVRVEAAVGH